MKHLLYFKWLLCLANLCLLPSVEARTQRELNGPWQTCLLESTTQEGILRDTFCVNLPHNWDDYFGYRQLTHGNLHGKARYWTQFEQAGLAADQRAFLRFEGVGSYARIRLNGHDLGRHAGGRVTFTLDVTDALQAGVNYLEVTAEHPDLISDLPCVCGGCSSEWGFSEGSQPLGLFRPVVLETTHQIRIEPFGVHIWHNDALTEVFINTELKNYGQQARKLSVQHVLKDASGTPVLTLTDSLTIEAGQTIVHHQTAPLDSVKTWSGDNPYLYQLTTSLSDQQSLIDHCDTDFGFRSLSWPVKRNDGDGRFYLNGQAVFLNGVCEYEHLLGAGHAFSHQQVEARVKQLLNAGFNAFRDAHQPHHLDYQRYWDQHGVLFWTQLSAHIWYDTPEFRRQFKAQLRQWVKERRNSPSVVLWGLQNESILPEDFARECCDIIREMDPTAVTMRAITTCNGGVGTDWNVVQNWSGTYGGNPENYHRELAMPNQLLNGEYGAWRTFGLHEEPGQFQQEGAYTEERFCQLMEMKIRLAEQAKDSVCGQFQWIYNSHDNPGRRQPDEAFRVIDRVGPVNYKGLVTPWEEPTDAYYMYRSNYVSADADPMVYIVSHTWPDRFPAPRYADIEVYSNCDSVRLYNDYGEHLPLGTEIHPNIKGRHFVFRNKWVQYNLLYALGYRKGRVVARDVVVLHHLQPAPHFDQFYPQGDDVVKASRGYRYLYRINCGGDDYTDRYGQVWQQDNLSYSSSWAQRFPSMNPYQASQRVSYDPVGGSREWPLLGHYRYGRQQLAYRLPLPNGRYRVELYFLEPWHGRGGSVDCKGLRLFDVAINGKTLLNDLDLWAEAGYHQAVKKVLEVEVTQQELRIDFPEVLAGQAVISAIAVATKDKKTAEAFRTTPYEHPAFPDSVWTRYVTQWTWQAADSLRMERMPADLLPTDKNPRPKATYPALQADHQGCCTTANERNRDCLLFTDNCEDNLIRWSISTGLAQVYALRFNYRNTAEKELPLRMRLLSVNGTVLQDIELTFPRNDRGWKVLSTTTGSYINAGNYWIELSGTDMKGLSLESLDVQ